MSDDPFFVNVSAWVDRAKERQELALRAIAEAALARVKELTPVKTGYLRSNWQIVAGGSAQAIVSGDADRSADSQGVILKLKAGDTWSIVNPVVYARRIEFGFTGTDSRGRHYEQHGVGMMQQVITEMPQIAAKAIRDLDR